MKRVTRLLVIGLLPLAMSGCLGDSQGVPGDPDTLAGPLGMIDLSSWSGAGNSLARVETVAQAGAALNLSAAGAVEMDRDGSVLVEVHTPGAEDAFASTQMLVAFAITAEDTPVDACSCWMYSQILPSTSTEFTYSSTFGLGAEFGLVNRSYGAVELEVPQQYLAQDVDETTGDRALILLATGGLVVGQTLTAYIAWVDDQTQVISERSMEGAASALEERQVVALARLAEGEADFAVLIENVTSAVSVMYPGNRQAETTTSTAQEVDLPSPVNEDLVLGRHRDLTMMSGSGLSTPGFTKFVYTHRFFESTCTWSQQLSVGARSYEHADQPCIGQTYTSSPLILADLGPPSMVGVWQQGGPLSFDLDVSNEQMIGESLIAFAFSSSIDIPAVTGRGGGDFTSFPGVTSG